MSTASQEHLIRDLLRSHNQLPLSQLSSLSASLSDKMAQCDDELTQLRAREKELAIYRSSLEEQYIQCQSISAPIRRLPAEILAEIFAIAVVTAPEFETIKEEPSSTSVALHLLSNAPIRTISQVCYRWSIIALGTPSLWTELVLSFALWRTPSSTEKAMTLLETTLRRSATSPLQILFVNITESPSHVPALELLAKHSARWLVVRFTGPATDLQVLSGATTRRNLPLLERLTVLPVGNLVEPVLLFANAPRLADVALIGGSNSRISLPNLTSLSTIRYRSLASTDIATVITAISSLSESNRLHLQFYLDDWTSNRSHTLDLALTPTSSNVGHLSIKLVGEFFRHHCQKALSSIFTALTPPSLSSLSFHSEKYPRFPLVWPQPQFLGLSERSGFQTTLTSLSLSHINISQTQLLQLLPALPALTSLELADHERINGRGTNVRLITDPLFAALTARINNNFNSDLNSNSDAGCSPHHLVPNLHTLTLHSRLQFDDKALMEMILSRVRVGRFTCSVGLLLNWDLTEARGREVDAVILGRLKELVSEGDLVLSLPVDWK
ncbi:F-box domain-containing protein [Favolaschia claudopus]|uniref:F-box domain-containing protein n=1 Tax=Favolaschia claudopus TaxID=2862362 RepID=A0AAW0BA58_9AGAR